MFGLERNKERQRFYLLAGMGGRAARRKHKLMLRWALITGFIVSLLLGTGMYFVQMYWR